MSATAEAPTEILIPSLPNDVALQCLARVPRQYHPVLATVSKPIRSLLSSQEFFAARSALNSTELLLYLLIRNQSGGPRSWLTVYGRPNPNDDDGGDNKSNIIIAPVPGVPDDWQDWSQYAVVVPRIYVFGGEIYGLSSPELWIFDCRFHTWERGPSMPTTVSDTFRPNRIFCLKITPLFKTVVLDGKIYVIGCWTVENSWVHVFDTVDRRWEAVPSPKLVVYGRPVVGCAIRGREVCVWLNKEELKFDPATKTWEVFESRTGYGLDWNTDVCEVNGVLYCYDRHSRLIKGFDERIGEWKKLKFVNKGMRSHWRSIRMGNVGGSLVIMGSARFRNLESTVGVWCVEIEVNKDGNEDLQGQVLWSEMVYSTQICSFGGWPLLYACVPVSL
ncbi:F-box/kelch-repeat protein SKIP6 [Morus notabilis]|uniref:F-box/kelch-repeat protein SKIP6 n=1 Tax=Morus notabilis TaxID=981085 RepID=W9S005_9ROSA|nr:F-box/kelch-repeat protein SKIP6 [Morus notabilis]EXC19714.1 F-box/kelch-repeat protein SKIP6 [Morus notabilis]